jgi:hypothetical protein
MTTLITQLALRQASGTKRSFFSLNTVERRDRCIKLFIASFTTDVRVPINALSTDLPLVKIIWLPHCATYIAYGGTSFLILCFNTRRTHCLLRLSEKGCIAL